MLNLLCHIFLIIIKIPFFISPLQNGFKTFLGVVPAVANWNAKQDEFSLILDNNPLCDFVELPEDHPNLLYSNIVCGVIRGALEMVYLIVCTNFVYNYIYLFMKGVFLMIYC